MSDTSILEDFVPKRIESSTSSPVRLFIPLPFPLRVVQKSKKLEETEKEILETFRKVEVNIPLLYAVKQIFKYAKFIKELCTHRRHLKGNEKVNMGRNVSALIAKHGATIPEKCKDPRTFTIPCTIGNNSFDNAMLDLGAFINVMPLLVFTFFFLGPLRPTCVEIQLANRSIVHPTRLIEDVLVQVEGLFFPTSFYILNKEGEHSHTNAATIILGKQFLKTVRTKIDVHASKLTWNLVTV